MWALGPPEYQHLNRRWQKRIDEWLASHDLTVAETHRITVDAGRATVVVLTPNGLEPMLGLEAPAGEDLKKTPVRFDDAPEQPPL